MNMHKTAKLTPLGRERLVKMILPKAASRAIGMCSRAARKWLARYKSKDVDGLQDRSSRPKVLRKPTPANPLNGLLRCAANAKAWSLQTESRRRFKGLFLRISRRRTVHTSPGNALGRQAYRQTGRLWPGEYAYV